MNTMAKINELLLENNSNFIFYLKGQIRNIQKKVSAKNGMPYYVADLRIPKNISDDIYAAAFNIVNVCFSTDYVRKNGLNDEYMKNIKDNEALLQISYSCYVDKYKKDNEEFKTNRMTLYVEDLILTRNINKPSYNNNTINL